MKLPRRELGLLLLVLLPYFMGLLGQRALTVPDEGRYSEAAREMMVSGDWITPRVDGITFLDKPALHYWLQAVSMNLFGISEWSLRLAAALAGVAGVAMVFLSSRARYGRRTAWLSAAVLACNPLYFLASQYADMDLEVAVWISAALLLFLAGRRGGAHARWLFRGAWAAMGLAVMTKGLIGVVLPLATIAAWLLWSRRWREIRDWQCASGAAIFLMIVLPWYALAELRNPGFFHYFFIYQQFERFSGTGFNNAMPLWFYPAVLAVGFLPWTLCLPQALRQAWINARGNGAGADEYKLLLLWIAVMLAFFSIPQSKIVGYILPVTAPIALLMGDYLNRLLPRGTAELRPGRIMPMAILAGFGAALCLTLALGAGHWDTHSVRALALELKTELKAGDKVVAYQNYYEDLPLYLNADTPVFIVSKWRDPGILKTDNWRRDFYLSQQYRPTAPAWLIEEAQFAQMMRDDARVFVMTDDGHAGYLARRYGMHVISRVKNAVLMGSAGAS